MSATVIRGDARCLPLADASVDLVCTSPPFWSLRSYQDGGEHYEGQIGAEKTPAEYVDSLIACTREWVRVLRPSGSIWVNLGDKYVNPSAPGPRDSLPAGGRPGTPPMPGHRSAKQVRRIKADSGGLPPKSLMGLPWRYALRCIDDLGLILRAEVIWSKPNGLPESVTDRVRRSHETWFHMVRSPRYFSAVDTIREAHTGGAHSSGNGASRRWVSSNDGQRHRSLDTDPSEYNPLGKLPGSVWTIPTEPLTVPAELGIDHFAAFPTEWPRRIIQGWSPSGICTACGEGRRPVTLAEKEFLRPSAYDREPDAYALGATAAPRQQWANVRNVRAITGEACGCIDATASTRPSVVLDPFGGTGTTALVAKALGRHGISVDMSADYCRLARWRTTDPGEVARAMQVPKPPKQADGQGNLFEVVA